MLDDESGPDWGDDGTPRMTLLAINETYWLYDGAEFLNQMLLGKGYFPVPIRCLMFEDAFELRAFVGEGHVLTDYWGINPDIVERLRRDNHLLEMPAREI
ncbi:MAG: hypothetical protein ACE5FS_00575 [Paracoccaceae bacterium]